MNVDALLQPLAGDSPCGQNLEDTQLLASFDSFRVFGQATPLSSDVDWRAIAARAHEALAQSKDLRPLTYLAAAALRTEGIGALVQLLQVASAWLKSYWKEVYPLIDDDAILRRNALNGFADPMAVLDALRRVPMIVNRQLGSINFRHTEIAGGRLNRAEGEGETPSEDQIRAVFTAAPPGEVAQLDALLADGLAAIKEISETMSAEGGGSEAVPDFAPMQVVFARMRVRHPAVRGQCVRRRGGFGRGRRFSDARRGRRSRLDPQPRGRDPRARCGGGVFSCHRTLQSGAVVRRARQAARRGQFS